MTTDLFFYFIYFILAACVAYVLYCMFWPWDHPDLKDHSRSKAAYKTMTQQQEWERGKQVTFMEPDIEGEVELEAKRLMSLGYNTKDLNELVHHYRQGVERRYLGMANMKGRL